MNEPSKYFAFISYKREDEEWAVWLQHELEYYHLPASLNGREDLPKVFRPVFRDIDELKAGNLPKQIHEALASSANLIVICSPRSAESIWVNKEIEAFVEIGNEKGINNLERVFPFIVEGTPHAKDKADECFPKVLRDLTDDKERIGGNVNESGRDKAFIKVMAGMLPNVSMDMLWNRYERDKAEEERRKREEREKLLILQSRFVTTKAKDILTSLNVDDIKKEKAILLLLEILPKNLEQPERPFAPDTEFVLRNATFEYSPLTPPISTDSSTVCFSANEKMAVLGKYIGTPTPSALPEYAIKIYDIKTGKKINEFIGKVSYNCLNSKGLMVAYSKADNLWALREARSGVCLFPLFDVFEVAFSHDSSLLATASWTGELKIWDIETGICKITMNTVEAGSYNIINSIRFVNNGKRIITSSKDNVTIWDISTGKKTITFTPPDIEKFTLLSFADFIQCANSIVCCFENCNDYDQSKLYIVDIQKRNIFRTIDLAVDIKSIISITYSNDKLFIISSKGLDVYDFRTGNLVCHPPISIEHIIEQKGTAIKAFATEYVSGLMTQRVVSFDYEPLNILIHKTREKYKTKSLTEEEKKKYYII